MAEQYYVTQHPKLFQCGAQRGREGGGQTRDKNKKEKRKKKELEDPLPAWSTIVACAACPYRSMTPYTLSGTLEAATPWSTPLTKKCNVPFGFLNTPTLSPTCQNSYNVMPDNSFNTKKVERMD